MPMLRRELLAAEHAALLAMADELLVLASKPAGAVGLAALRWRMTRTLTLHLAREDQRLYPRLRAGPDARIRAIAGRFADDMGGLADAWRGYVTDWTVDRIERDWAGFGGATRAILVALRRRVLAEERELYPYLDRRTDGFAQRAQPASPS